MADPSPEEQCQGILSHCQGCYSPLMDGSEFMRISTINNIRERINLFIRNSAYYVRKEGINRTFHRILKKIRGSKWDTQMPQSAKNSESNFPKSKSLNLNSGDWVEVKNESDILTTLDGDRKNSGLLWMAGMERFCGNKYRVFKRLTRIRIESTGEVRKMRNTVLLEGVYCNGEYFGNCDRSCFYFWREAWLKRTLENN